jgi:hypothetical protein
MKRIIRYVVAGLCVLATFGLVAHLLISQRDGRMIDDVAIACIAIILAIQQFLDAGTELETLNDVGRQLSTQFLAPFPQNLVAIRRLVSELHANEDVRIMVDYAGYGSYSNPDEFLRYRGALEESASNSEMKIKMLIYGDGLGRAALRDQWPNLESFKTERAYPLLQEFYRKNRKLIDDWTAGKGQQLADFGDFEKSITYDDLLELKMQAQKKIQDILADKIEIRYIDTKLAVHA